MTREAVTLDNLSDFAYGEFGAMFQEKFNQVVSDCRQRPGIDKDREVIITIKVRPGQVKETGVRSVLVDPSIKTRVPVHRTEAYECAIDANGAVLFEALSPDNPDQLSLEDSVPENAAPKAKRETLRAVRG